jgi:hypothetical protein
MRKLLGLLVLLAVVSVGLAARDTILTETFVATASASYQRFTSDNNVALLTNDLGVGVTGLRVTFSDPVSSVAGQGIGASVSIVSNVEGVVVLSGDIPANGTVDVGWPAGSGEIVAAEWLQGGNAAGAVNLHAPMAAFHGRCELYFSYTQHTHIMAEVRLDGTLSTSPDGSPIVRYLWEWSDGMAQEGPIATQRAVVNPFAIMDGEQFAGATLTVWNAAGESSTVSHVLFTFLVG